MTPIVTGSAAVDKLIDNYPTAHVNFGDFASVVHFGVVISAPEYVVLEYDHHWAIVEVLADHTGNVHWFCPRGCDIRVLRRLVASVFRGGLTQIQGTPPAGKPSERAAKTLNRALGAVKQGELYVLTRHRFVNYTPTKHSTKGMTHGMD